MDQKLGDALLEPTRIYVKTVLALLEEIDVHAISHITGGGFYENLPRVLKEDQDALVDLRDYELPEIFKLIGQWGEIEEEEMFSTFNMGIGMVLVVGKEDEKKTLELLEKLGEDHVVLGEIIEGTKEVKIWRS